MIRLLLAVVEAWVEHFVSESYLIFVAVFSRRMCYRSREDKNLHFIYCVRFKKKKKNQMSLFYFCFFLFFLLLVLLLLMMFLHLLLPASKGGKIEMDHTFPLLFVCLPACLVCLSLFLSSSDHHDQIVTSSSNIIIAIFFTSYTIFFYFALCKEWFYNWRNSSF